MSTDANETEDMTVFIETLLNQMVRALSPFANFL